MAIYNGKHCVFEMVGCEISGGAWNSNSNKDDDNAYNNWNISNMRTTILPAKLLLLSNTLQDNLSNTTIQTAKNGNSSSLVSTSDKLFLIAGKELGTTTMAPNVENNALTTYTYWTTHTQASDRVKNNLSNVASEWWVRSPRYSTNYATASVASNGSYDYHNAILSDLFVSPCFAF